MEDGSLRDFLNKKFIKNEVTKKWMKILCNYLKTKKIWIIYYQKILNSLFFKEKKLKNLKKTSI